MRPRAAIAALVLAAVAAAAWWALTKRPSAPAAAPPPGAVETIAAAPGLARSNRGPVAKPTPPEPPESTEPEPPPLLPFRYPQSRPTTKTFTLHAVDALTGERLSCGWGVGGHEANAGEACALRDDRVPIHFYVYPPNGYMTWRLEGCGTQWAYDAVRAEAVLPLHAAMNLDVTVTYPGGGIARTSRISHASATGQTLLVRRHEHAGTGTIRIEDIPFLPGEPVTASFWDETDGDWIGDLATTIPTRASAVWRETVVLERSDFVAAPDDFLLDPGAAPPAPAASGPEVDARPVGVGAVRLLVLDRAGRPQSGATVGGVPVDGQGRAVLSPLPAGRHRVSARVPGRLPASAVVDVRPDATTDVTLREPEGARLDVIVVDDAGRPRPSALLSLEAGWFDVRDGVQRLDLFTDALGRRSLSRVEPGALTVTATWGGRTGSGTVVLRDGERATVRVVAK